MVFVLKVLGVVAFVEAAAVFVLAERLWPAKDRPILRNNWQHDLTYWVGNRLLVQFVAVMLAAGRCGSPPS